MNIKTVFNTGDDQQEHVHCMLNALHGCASVVKDQKVGRGILRGVEQHGYLPWAKKGVLLDYPIWVHMENIAKELKFGCRSCFLHSELPWQKEQSLSKCVGG